MSSPRHRTPFVSPAAGRWARACAAIVGAALLAGCGGGEADPTTGGGVFVAFPRDFDGFRGWTSFELGADQDDGVTVAGNRKAYLNKIPPTGSTSFPVGTVIVKTIGEETAMPGQTFAMAKRGEPFNAMGAVGWEWFELTEIAGAPPAIRWRGVTPPAGEMYAGIAGGACNVCHAMGSANDFVPSAELSLSAF